MSLTCHKKLQATGQKYCHFDMCNVMTKFNNLKLHVKNLKLVFTSIQFGKICPKNNKKHQFAYVTKELKQTSERLFGSLPTIKKICTQL